MKTINTLDRQTILFYAIGNCRTQLELMNCARMISQVCAVASEIEQELVRRVAAKQCALELSPFGNN